MSAWATLRATALSASLFALLFTGAGSPAWAGVVEDAAEILREVEQDGPDRPLPRTSGPPRTVPSSSAPPATSPASHPSTPEPSDRGEEPGRSAASGAGTAGGPFTSDELRADDSAREPNAQRRAFERRVSGYLVLLLLLAVVAAAFVGRSLEGRSGDPNDSE